MEYVYKKPTKWNSPFASNLIRRGLRVDVSIRETAGELVFIFPRELSGDEKAFLDRLIAQNKRPVRYEYGTLNIEDLIESKLGFRPVSVRLSPKSGGVIIDFEDELTPQQEKLLEDVLKGSEKVHKVSQ